MNVYGGTPWILYSNSFAAPSGGTATVRFQPNGIFANGFIDAVSVSVVPEIGTQILMLLGVATLSIARMISARPARQARTHRAA